MARLAFHKLGTTSYLKGSMNSIYPRMMINMPIRSIVHHNDNKSKENKEKSNDDQVPKKAYTEWAKLQKQHPWKTYFFHSPLGSVKQRITEIPYMLLLAAIGTIGCTIILPCLGIGVVILLVPGIQVLERIMVYLGMSKYTSLDDANEDDQSDGL
eukprot:307055_1